jgi:hypothetical protein
MNLIETAHGRPLSLPMSTGRPVKRLDDPMLSNRAFAIFSIVAILIAITLLLAPKERAAAKMWNSTTASAHIK